MPVFKNYVVDAYDITNSPKTVHKFSVTVLNGGIQFIDQYGRKTTWDTTFNFNDAIEYAHDGKFNSAFMNSANNYLHCKLTKRQIREVRFINQMRWWQKWDNQKWLITTFVSFWAGFALRWIFGC